MPPISVSVSASAAAAAAAAGSASHGCDGTFVISDPLQVFVLLLPLLIITCLTVGVVIFAFVHSSMFPLKKPSEKQKRT